MIYYPGETGLRYPACRFLPQLCAWGSSAFTTPLVKAKSKVRVGVRVRFRVKFKVQVRIRIRITARVRVGIGVRVRDMVSKCI